MNKDSVIHSFKFDLQQLSQQRHQAIENRIVRVFDQSFYSIINRLSSKYSSQQDIVAEQLIIDLGEIEQEELERLLPNKFEEAFSNYLKKQEKQNDSKYLAEEDSTKKVHPLLYFLNFGVYPWYAPKSKGFVNSWLENIQTTSFAKYSLSENWTYRMIKRLVQLAFNIPLQKTLAAWIPQETKFILDYHKQLLIEHHQKKIGINDSKDEFHRVVWEFTLRYVLNAKGSKFSKKQFIATHLKLLAVHYNIHLESFFQLFFQGLASLNIHSNKSIELLTLLKELSEEFNWDSRPETEEKTLELNIQEVEHLLNKVSISTSEKRALKNWIQEEKHLQLIKRFWIDQLKEKLLYASLEIMIGQEGKDQIESYHTLLWAQHSSQHSTSLNAFKKASWTFTFDFFSRTFSSNFQARNFVHFHSQKMARHFNLNINSFLNSLIQNLDQLQLSHGQGDFLLQLLLSLSQESTDHKKLNHKLELQVEKMADEFKEEWFHSDRERYLFFESWGIKLIEISKSKSKQPIHYLMRLLKKYGFNQFQLIKSLKPLLAYESKDHPNYRKKTKLKTDLFDSLALFKGDSEQELKLFLLNKKELTFSLLQKLIAYPSKISSTLADQIKKHFKKPNILEQFLNHWVHQFNAKSIEHLIALLFGPQHLMVFEVNSLFHATTMELDPNQTKKLFFELAFARNQKFNLQEFWEQLIEESSQRFQENQEEYRRKLILQILQKAKLNTAFLKHYAIIKSLQSINAIIPRPVKGAFNTRLTHFFFQANTAISVEDQNFWEQFLKESLHKKPNLWWKFMELNKRSLTALEQKIGQFSKEVQLLYILRLSQYQDQKRIRKHLINSGSKDSIKILPLLLFLESKMEKETYHFSHWSREEIQQLKSHLRGDKNKLFNWTNGLKREDKTNFIRYSNIQDFKLLLSLYESLENTYQNILPSNRVYSYSEFELFFWRIVFSASAQKRGAWYIIQHWLLMLNFHFKINLIKQEQLAKKLKGISNIKFKQLEENISAQLSKEEEMPEAEENSQSQEEEKEDLPLQKCDLENAGLIILHPFLKQLFVSFELLDEKHQFLSVEKQQKAVFILHYLATGIENSNEAEEDELAFAKLLCGIAISEVLSFEFKIEAEEKEMLDELLKACIKHWDRLGNTSINSLRNTFLRRKGRIEEIDNAYQLHIEKSGMDILLDYLPWSISLIRLPWLEMPIYTSWRS